MVALTPHCILVVAWVAVATWAVAVPDQVLAHIIEVRAVLFSFSSFCLPFSFVCKALRWLDMWLRLLFQYLGW